MQIYNKIYKILDKTFVPENNTSELNKINSKISDSKNKIDNKTSGYYRERLSELYFRRNEILDDLVCYHFYSQNEKPDEYDLHNIRGHQINFILNAIFDYRINNNIKTGFKLITGNGNVINPKTIKYLRYYKFKFKVKNGYIEVNTRDLGN